jgi:hypothetical protein
MRDMDALGLVELDRAETEATNGGCDWVCWVGDKVGRGLKYAVRFAEGVYEQAETTTPVPRNEIW